jgi:hypothetical protein
MPAFAVVGVFTNNMDAIYRKKIIPQVSLFLGYQRL